MREELRTIITQHIPVRVSVDIAAGVDMQLTADERSMLNRTMVVLAETELADDLEEMNAMEVTILERQNHILSIKTYTKYAGSVVNRNWQVDLSSGTASYDHNILVVIDARAESMDLAALSAATKCTVYFAKDIGYFSQCLDFFKECLAQKRIALVAVILSPANVALHRQEGPPDTIAEVQDEIQLLQEIFGKVAYFQDEQLELSKEDVVVLRASAKECFYPARNFQEEILSQLALHESPIKASLPGPQAIAVSSYWHQRTRAMDATGTRTEASDNLPQQVAIVSGDSCSCRGSCTVL
jgi:hypothetical protein